MIEYVYMAMIFVGVFFMLTAGLGVLRFKDVFTRLHAASKGTTFGFGFVVLGCALMMGDSGDIAKAIVAVIFQYVTAPIASHMIARCALKKGMKPVDAKGNDITALG